MKPHAVHVEKERVNCQGFAEAADTSLDIIVGGATQTV